jgi:hypothetical protein
VEWIVNTEMPFTREAELEAALEGFSVHRPRDITRFMDEEPACWLTGEPVVVIPVRFDPGRPAVLNYGVQIVLPEAESNFGDGDKPPGDDGDGGDPGGNPDPPAISDGDEEGGGPKGEPEGGGGGEGGDPGGDPDPPARTAEDEGD